ncbi:Serine/threonine-protein kinase edr1 [Phlyctochytrium bullatum]|nr:Serine/threonine-protein kinase edr1 [Phlyctochytrium bullatum]
MEVVAAIFSVSATIFNVAKEVKANNEQCRQLVDRIRTIEAAVKTNVASTAVPRNREDPRFIALLRLQNVLEDCRTEIQQHTDSKLSVVKVFRQLACRDVFAGLHCELDRCLNDIQTAFVIRFPDLLVAQRDRMTAFETDLAFLAKNVRLLVDLYVKGVPVGSINPQQAEESFKKRLEKEQTIMTAFLENQGAPTVEEFSDYLIASTDVRVGDEVGKGGFGQVHVGEWNFSKVAIKKLFCRPDDLTPRVKATFKNEAKMLLYANHENVVKFYGLVADETNYMLVMEFFEKKCLRTVINRTFDSLTWRKKADYARQIALGMAYLHRQNVIHCDLKCNNILVREDDTVAIADFGLAKVKQETRNSLTKVKVGSADANAGTIAFMAPELFEPGNKPTFATDVYAFSMILFELADGGYPFSEVPQDVIPHRVRHGERPAVPFDTPVLIANVMTQSWTATPSQRPRFDELVLALNTNNDAILRLRGHSLRYILNRNHNHNRNCNLNHNHNSNHNYNDNYNRNRNRMEHRQFPDIERRCV